MGCRVLDGALFDKFSVLVQVTLIVAKRFRIDVIMCHSQSDRKRPAFLNARDAMRRAVVSSCRHKPGHRPSRPSIMSTPIHRSPGQRFLDMSSTQDSLMDDSEVEDPMSPSPSPVKKKQVKRRKQAAAGPSSSGSAGSAPRAGSRTSSSGAAVWNKPLRADTSLDKRKGKRSSPSTATNVGGPSLSGKSVHDEREHVRHCCYDRTHYFARKSLSLNALQSYHILSYRRTRNSTDGQTQIAIYQCIDEDTLAVPAILASSRNGGLSLSDVRTRRGSGSARHTRHVG